MIRIFCFLNSRFNLLGRIWSRFWLYFPLRFGLFRLFRRRLWFLLRCLLFWLLKRWLWFLFRLGLFRFLSWLLFILRFLRRWLWLLLRLRLFRFLSWFFRIWLLFILRMALLSFFGRRLRFFLMRRGWLLKPCFFLLNFLLFKDKAGLLFFETQLLLLKLNFHSLQLLLLLLELFKYIVGLIIYLLFSIFRWRFTFLKLWSSCGCTWFRFTSLEFSLGLEPFSFDPVSVVVVAGAHILIIHQSFEGDEPGPFFITILGAEIIHVIGCPDFEARRNHFLILSEVWFVGFELLQIENISDFFKTLGGEGV